MEIYKSRFVDISHSTNIKCCKFKQLNKIKAYLLNIIYKLNKILKISFINFNIFIISTKNNQNSINYSEFLISINTLYFSDIL